MDKFCSSVLTHIYNRGWFIVDDWEMQILSTIFQLTFSYHTKRDSYVYETEGFFSSR